MTRPRLPRRRWWRRALAGRGLDPDGRLLREVEEEYRAVLAARPDGTTQDVALRLHLEQSVAPALAVYRALRGRGRDRQGATAEVRELVAAQMAPVLGVVGALDRLRLPFPLLRAVNRRVVPRLFPAAGFTITWRQDDGDALGFDFSACYYLRVLRHFGAAELTGVFCHGDELAYERMPRTVRFTRTGTLADGASHCDFTLHPVRRPPAA